MKTKSPVKSFKKALTALALLLLFMSVSSTSPTYASPNAIESDPRRLDILAIAEQYANYTWTGTNNNVFHPSMYDDGRYIGREVIGMDLGWLTNDIQKVWSDPIDTPDNVSLEGTALGGWWLFGDGANTGIPYAWGGATTIDTVYLPTQADLGLSFDDKLSRGFPAGDITPDKGGNTTYTDGVDCAGLVSVAWKLGIYTLHGHRLRFFEELKAQRKQGVQLGFVGSWHLSQAV